MSCSFIENLYPGIWGVEKGWILKNIACNVILKVDNLLYQVNFQFYTIKDLKRAGDTHFLFDSN